MDIEKIKDPSFISSLDISSIKSLCGDIRGKIINDVSEKGGYLSSNLSCVEIAVTLNKCFSKEDRIIYDGPRTNYTDRILHGESIQNNEYYSSLSNVYGLCISRDIQHKQNNIISVVNSDSVFSGSNIETLNQIGSEKRKMIIVFNDDTSIDKGIGIIDKFISDIRRTKAYNSIKDNVKDFIRPQKGGEKIIEGIHNIKSNIRKNVVDEGLFGDYNIDYIGPVDGHNINELISAFEIAKTKEYPCVVHCITTKGKGYVYAESNTNEAFVKTGPFDVKTGKKYIEKTDGYKNCVDIVADYLLQSMSDNKDIVVVSSNNKNETNLTKIFAKYPDRCFEAGSSIENALGFACGFSLDDKKPFISIDSSKLLDGYAQLIKQVDNLDKSVIIGLLSDNDDDVRILKNLQNCIVATASNYCDLLSLLNTAINTNKPFIIRYPNCFIKYDENSKISKFDVGKWQILANNKVGNTVIITNGRDLETIKNFIEKNEYPYTLIDAQFINPIDTGLLDKVFTKAKHIYLYNNAVEDKVLNLFNTKKYKAKITVLGKMNTKALFAQIEKGKDA